MSHPLGEQIAIIRHELDLLEGGATGPDAKVSAATISAAAYSIASLTDALNSCARLTHSNGRLDERYLPVAERARAAWRRSPVEALHLLADETNRVEDQVADLQHLVVELREEAGR